MKTLKNAVAQCANTKMWDAARKGKQQRCLWGFTFLRVVWFCWFLLVEVFVLVFWLVVLDFCWGFLMFCGLFFFCFFFCGQD